VPAAGGATGSGGTGTGGAEPTDCDGYVGITYDDGPTNTDAFVNALSDAGLTPVTFFVNGTNISSHPGAIEAMLTVGEVQSHAFTHTDLGGSSVADVKSQLEQNNSAIMAAGAPKPIIFSPPYGSTSANMSAAAAELGMIVITWDVDSQDWNGASPAQIVSANESMNDGDVILLHENPNNSLLAIPDIAAALEAKGLCPGRLDPTTGRAVAP
jgi:peptidoglycan/xylan/chitin deacetylase (PgdA/CDA1 family)